jgi:hypothetical protein
MERMNQDIWWQSIKWNGYFALHELQRTGLEEVTCYFKVLYCYLPIKLRKTMNNLSQDRWYQAEIQIRHLQIQVTSVIMWADLLDPTSESLHFFDSAQQPIAAHILCRICLCLGESSVLHFCMSTLFVKSVYTDILTCGILWFPSIPLSKCCDSAFY